MKIKQMRNSVLKLTRNNSVESADMKIEPAYLDIVIPVCICEKIKSELECP